MFRFGFHHRLIVGLAAACFVLLFVAELTYSTLARNKIDWEWVSHTLLVLEKLSDLQSQVGDAETSQRGFLLTGDDSYLRLCENSLQSIPQSINAIRQLTSDNPVQQGNIGRLASDVDARLATLLLVIQVRKREGLTATQNFVTAGEGELRMERIRADISGMKVEENRLLLIRNAELDLSAGRAKAFIIFGEALGFCFLLIAGAIVQQEMSKRRRGEEEIRRLNVDLERRVTERTRELAARSQDLERSNTELQQFAYVASHDLQEPLRTISSFSQLLARRYSSQLDDKAREFIAFTIDGCSRMQTLINDLLTFSRVGTECKPLHPVRCDAVLDRALKNLRAAIQESGAEIRRTALPVVMADEVQLAQLFQNLIANSIKFRGSQSPQIDISAERKDTSWTIRVRDNGIGISPEHNQRIFVIFQRLHNRTEYSGTGIGLAVCKKIAERHGGRIWVDPAPGGGSIFSFTITAGEIAHASSQEEKTQGELRSNAAAH
jgi:signal transduction histidine kinase